MRAISSFLALAFGLLLTGCGHHVSNYQFTNSSIEPSAAGRVQVSHDKNGNSVVNVRVYHLADPAQLAPPKAGYVVWEQPKGMPAKNLGQLKVDHDLNGSLSATTVDKNFDVFVTAEDNPHGDVPSGPEVLRTSVSTS